MIDLTGKKFLLLIIYSPIEHSSKNFPIEGRTRLIKMGFLFDKEIRKKFEKDKNVKMVLPEFEAWNYGPFSKGLINDLEFLKNRGYILINKGKSQPTSEELDEYSHWIEDIEDSSTMEYTSEEFVLSENKGIQKAQEIWNDLTNNQKNIIQNFKTEMVNNSLYKILEYVYKKYPDYTEKSKIKNKFS